MGLRSIGQEWGEFRDAVFEGRQISAVQDIEMQKAFYGGVVAMLSAMSELGEESCSADDGVKWLESWWAECKEFADSLRQ